MDIDELQLLYGKKIVIDKVGYLHPLTIEDIMNIGEKKYYQYLHSICFELEDMKLNMAQKIEFEEKNIKTYNIIISGCINDFEYCLMICDAFKLFFRETVYFSYENLCFFIGNIKELRIISADNFEHIKRMIRLQNGMSKDEILEENPKDERVKRLLELRKSARAKLARAKAKENSENETPLTFADLVSVMCANANGVNYENVWKMNIYMFQNQFQRMKLIEDYDLSIRSLLAGAKSEEVELKHYISHI